MSQDNLHAVVEALLFSSDKPLALEQLRQALDNLAQAQVKAIVDELRAEYEANNRGMRIVEIAGGFQMVTGSGFAPFLKKLYKNRKVERLSKPALETLAIIAYKQPLTRLEIESLRNVNIDGVVRTLFEKDLIRVAGRKETPGRPRVYATTKRFLEYFGLNSLEELPKMDLSDIEAAGAALATKEEAHDASIPAPTN